jgi:Mn-dependent DtxR family transcriptional regulator
MSRFSGHGGTLVVVAGTAEMLRSTLGEDGFAILPVLAAQAEPASGRSIAATLKVSPTTASARLRRLEAAGFVRRGSRAAPCFGS